MEEVADLVHEGAMAEIAGEGHVLEEDPPAVRIFLDGAGDGVVEAAIERMEIVHGDGDVAFRGQLRHRLAEIPVFVHDLVDRESLDQELPPTECGRFFDHRAGGNGRA